MLSSMSGFVACPAYESLWTLGPSEPRGTPVHPMAAGWHVVPRKERYYHAPHAVASGSPMSESETIVVQIVVSRWFFAAAAAAAVAAAVALSSAFASASEVVCDTECRGWNFHCPLA